MANPFDQFDAPTSTQAPVAGNPFDQFDPKGQLPQALPDTASPIDYAASSLAVTENEDARQKKEQGSKIAPDIIRRAVRSNPFTAPLYPFIASREDDTLRNAFQGVTLGTGDEITAGIRSLAGENYQNALLDERSRLSAQKENDPLSAYTAEGVGSLLPLAALRGKARPSLMGRMYESGKVGGILGGIEGFNKGEDGVENRLGNALKTAAYTAGTAFGLTPAIEAAGGLFNVLGRTLGKTRAVVDPNVVPDEIMAKAIERSGKTPAQIRAEYDAGQALVNPTTKQTFNALGKTNDFKNAVTLSEKKAVARDYINAQQLENSSYLPETIADLGGDATQRLARAVRQVPGEGSRIAAETLSNRQGGGLNFQKVGLNDTPQNQYDRMLAHLKESMGVSDKNADFAKVMKNLRGEHRTEANTAYTNAFKQQDPFDLTPAIRNVESELLQQAPNSEQKAALTNALRMFSDLGGNKPNRVTSDLAMFDRAKRSLDDLIEKNRGYTAKLLRQFKEDLLAAVHDQGRNKLYKAAREEYANRASLMDAAEMGRQYIKGNDVSHLDILALSPQEQRMARMGALQEFRQYLGGQTLGPTVDFTRKLRNPEMINALRAILPGNQQVGSKAGQYMNDAISREMRMSRTNNIVLGNSTTNEKAADTVDLAKFASWSQRLKDSGGLFQAAMTFADSHIQKLFAMNEKTAATIARQIFSTDPRVVRATLSRLEARYGRQSVQGLVTAIQQNVQRMSAGTGALINAGPNQQ